MRRLLNLDDKEFYTKLFAIVIPIAVQNLINFSVSMIDTLMLGVLGEVQLSAAAIANQMSFMFMILSFGIAAGSSVLCAQYWGRGDIPQIKKAISLMYRVVLMLAVIFMSGALLFPHQIVGIFITDTAVIAEAVIFLRIIGLSFLFSGFTNTTIGLLRSIGTVKISVVVYSVSLLVNATLNYALIFGKFGCPQMGIRGAAIATLTARIVESIITAVYMFKYENKLKVKLSDLKTMDYGLVPVFLQYASPVLINELLWTTGNSLVVVIIGRMGREFVAANSICSVLFQFAGVVIFGLSSAASTIIGHTVGEGDYEKVKQRAFTFMRISVLVGLFASLIMFTGRYVLIEFYNISDLARSYAYSITGVASVLVIFQTVCMVLMMGVLRGGGDTKFVTVADVFFMWLVALPLGAYTGLVLGLPVGVVYACLKCDEVVKSMISATRVIRGRWIKDITR